MLKRLIERVRRIENQHADPNAEGPLRINWIRADPEGPITGATADVSAFACSPFTVEATGVGVDGVLVDLSEQIQARVTAGVVMALVAWRTAAT